MLAEPAEERADIPGELGPISRGCELVWGLGYFRFSWGNRGGASMSDEHPARTSEAGAASSNIRGFIAKDLATSIAAIMVVLAMLGAGITLIGATWARKYWLLLVPVYGTLCTFAAWHHARTLDRTVVRQILHWISVGIAIALDYTFLQGTGGQTATATGLSSLLILALGCLLAGVHMEWLFALVGLVLLAIVIVVSMARQYLVLVFLIGGVVVALIFAVQWARKKWLA